MTVDVYHCDELSRDNPFGKPLVTVWAMHQPERTDNSTTARHLYVCSSPHSPERQILIVQVSSGLAAKNFIIRLLYKDTYWLQCRLSHNLTFSRFSMLEVFLMWCFQSLSVTLLRSVSCVFTIKIRLDWSISTTLLIDVKYFLKYNI